MERILILLLRVYRAGIAPFWPVPACRYYPSCSHYAETAIRRYGPFKGVRLALRRLLSCHPFNPGGYDPVK